jgi:hypothetical protein
VDVHDLARLLAERFSVLDSGGPRSHRRTLADTVTWSWDLLDTDERDALAWLSVIAGGWTLPSAPALLGEGALDLAARLVDHQLVTVRRDGAGSRYRMLEVVREFVAEQLDAAPYPRRLAGGPPTTGEEANLRAALAHCRDAGRTAVGLRIAVATAWWWYLAGALARGDLQRAEAELAARPGVGPRIGTTVVAAMAPALLTRAAPHGTVGRKGGADAERHVDLPPAGPRSRPGRDVRSARRHR